MRSLVTGGAGFIGATFVHCTSGRFPHHAVTVYDDVPTYAGNGHNLFPVEQHIRSVEGNITDVVTLDMPVAENDVEAKYAVYERPWRLPS